jgi:hypothetical protein
MLCNAAVRFLTVVTGDNPNGVARRFTAAHLQRLTGLMVNNTLSAQLRVAAAGVLVNVRPRGAGFGDEEQVIGLVCKGMTAALDLDPVCSALSSSLLHPISFIHSLIC